MKDLESHPFRTKLKTSQTKEELKFWRILQKILINDFPEYQHCVHKQAPIRHSRGFYIIDFYIGRLKLAFEIDGGYHWNDKQLDKDLKRDDFLQYKKGIKVIHFPNSLINKNGKKRQPLKDAIKKAIIKQIKLMARKKKKEILYANTGKQYKPSTMGKNAI